MQLNKGIHFYINIANYDTIIAEEEKKIGQPLHAIHAFDTFFTSIERYAMSLPNHNINIEKITGARIHLYICGEIKETQTSLFKVLTFSFNLASIINHKIGKYNSLVDFKVNAGASYGRFYDFTFKARGIEEETTIGYACNFAAKLQSVSRSGNVSIDDDIYNALDVSNQKLFEIVKTDKFKSYEKDCYYTTPFTKIDKVCQAYSRSISTAIDTAIEYANKTNLGEMEFSGVSEALNFSNLSKKNCKDINGIPFLADVRGFTKQFKEDDSNLNEMSIKTQRILSTMYNIIVEKSHGIHIQFQGDREFALFHDYSDYNSSEDAVLAGLRMIDEITGLSVCIGIGQAKGRLFATKFGARGNKDNILLGTTVSTADKFEDEAAKENQIVISKEMYKHLESRNSTLASMFSYSSLCNGCYVTTRGYTAYREAVTMKEHQKATKSHSYNGAWGIDE